jgi:hypothetical protein
MRGALVTAILIVATGCDRRVELGDPPNEPSPKPIEAEPGAERVTLPPPPAPPIVEPPPDEPARDEAARDEPTDREAAAPAADASDTTGDDLALVREPDTSDPVMAGPEQVFSSGESHPGLLVHLVDVPIRGKAGRGVWVGYEPGEQVFVVPMDPSSVEFLAVGARIDVRGELVAAPGAEHVRRHLALDASSARRLARAPHYVQAWSVTEP